MLYNNNLSGLTSFVYHVSRETIACALILAHRPRRPHGRRHPPTDTIRGLTSLVYHVPSKTIGCARTRTQRPATHTGTIDQVIASVAFLSSVALLPLFPAFVIAAEAAQRT